MLPNLLIFLKALAISMLIGYNVVSNVSKYYENFLENY